MNMFFIIIYAIRLNEKIIKRSFNYWKLILFEIICEINKRGKKHRIFHWKDDRNHNATITIDDIWNEKSKVITTID